MRFKTPQDHKAATKRANKRTEVGWHRGPDDIFPAEREAAWALFRIIIVQVFNTMLSGDLNDLTSWARICRSLGILPMPERFTGPSRYDLVF
jgi:hypothetical protein